MRRRLGIALLDRDAILVHQLRPTSDGVKRWHAVKRGVATSLAIGYERLGDILLREVRRQEWIVGDGGSLAKRPRLVVNIPAIHLQRVAATAIILLGHLEPGDPGLFAGRGLVDELRRRRFSDQAEHERHHRLALLVIERELRHPVAFVVALVLDLFVVVAPRCAELLPEKALTLMRQEFLEEKAGRGVY